MLNNTSIGNKTFWEEMKIPLCDSLTKSYQNAEVSISEKRAQETN